MRKTDAERRAFLKSLKPRLVQIAETAAKASGPVDGEELHSRIAAARREPAAQLEKQPAGRH
jgi:hypothetical protein